MSFGYSIGDFVAAAGFARKALSLLASSSEPSLDKLRIGVRELQPRVEILYCRWTQLSTRNPSSATLAAIKQLTDRLRELLQLLEKSEKGSATHKTELQIKKMQSISGEAQGLVDSIEQYIRSEVTANIKTAIDFGQISLQSTEADGTLADKETLDNAEENAVPEQKLNQPLTSLSLIVHDLILVHGLAGHALGTWVGVESSWPDDLYPRTFPGARVCAYRYDSVALVKRNFAMNVVKEARNLIGFVVDDRNNVPVVFCTHGIGGFIVKIALIYAVHAQLFDESCARFLKFVSGLVFYGVPNLSLPFALERHIEDLHVVGFLRKADFLGKADGEMYRPSNFVFGNEETFMSIVHGRKIAVVYNFETLPTLTSRIPIFVTEPSTDFSRQHIGFLDGDHFSMCQFQTENDKNYKKLCQLVLEALENRQSGLLHMHNLHPCQSQNMVEQEHLFPLGAKTDNSNEKKRTSIPLHKLDLNDLMMNYTERFRAFCKHLQPSMAQWKRRLTAYKDCAWIEKSPSFSRWNTVSVNEMDYQERKLLLIRGTPGSGKSTLLYYILNRFARFKSDGEFVTIIVSHWCNRHYNETLTFNCMIRSFLWQLLFIKPSSFQLIYTSWLDLPETSDELLSLLGHIVKNLSNQSLLFLVDGIDNIQEEYDGLIFSMLDVLKTCPSVKIVFTSQNEQAGHEFLNKLSRDSVIMLPYDVDGLLPDTRSLVYDHIADLTRSYNLPEALSNEILDVALSKSQGNYRWIILFFQVVAQNRSIHFTQLVLRRISSDLFSLYHQLLAARPESQIKEFNLMVYIIQHSFEPFCPRDLNAVMAIMGTNNLEEVQNDYVFDLWSSSDLCEGPLVSIDSGNVFFTHDSFSDFLNNSSSEIIHRHNHEDTHYTLALACVRWLEHCGNRIENSDNTEFSEIPFLIYAARHWHEHCRKAIDRTISLIQAVHEKLLNIEPKFLQKVNSCAQLDIRIPGDDENILIFAAAVGLDFTLGMVRKINNGFDPNAELWDKAILRAFTNRHVSTLVQILELVENKRFFRKLLVEAIQETKSPCNLKTSRFVVDMLEASDRWYFDEVNELYDTALIPTIMLLALRHRRWKFARETYNSIKQNESMRNGNWRDTDGPAILCEAISAFQHNQDEVLEIEDLFALGLRLDIPDPTGETPLHSAVKSRYFSFINDSEAFMDDVDVTNGMGQTALHLASEAGFVEIVRELISLGANTDAQDHDKVSPLHLASLYGHIEVVKFLLSVGSNSNPQDREGRTPLLMAAARGETGVVEILFRQCVEISLADENGQRPLHLAIYNWWQPLATFLLNWSPSDINIQDKFGRTPLHVVASSGLDKFAESLLSKGADATALDNSGRSALHYAAESKYFSDSLLQLLVKFGNNPNLKDNKNLSSIDLAAKIGNTKAAQRLQKIADRASIISQDFEIIDKVEPVINVPVSRTFNDRVSHPKTVSEPIRRPPSPYAYTRPARASESDLGRRRYHSDAIYVVPSVRRERQYYDDRYSMRDLDRTSEDGWEPRRRPRRRELEVERREFIEEDRRMRRGRQRAEEESLHIERTRLEAELELRHLERRRRQAEKESQRIEIMRPPEAQDELRHMERRRQQAEEELWHIEKRRQQAEEESRYIERRRRQAEEAAEEDSRLSRLLRSTR